MKQHNTFSRMMALFLSMVMLMGMVFGSVFAAEAPGEPPAETAAITESAAEEISESSEPAAAAGSVTPAGSQEGNPGIVTAKGGADVWETPSENGTPITHLSMGSKVSVLDTRTTEDVLWVQLPEGWVQKDFISLAVETPTETSAEASSEVPAEVPTEITTEASAQTDTEVPEGPRLLDTEVQYYEDYFAVLNAGQQELQYQILLRNARFDHPQIHACTFEADPDVESLGFEIQLSGVEFHLEDNTGPDGEITVMLDSRFLQSDPHAIHVFDVSGESWEHLATGAVSVQDHQTSISFYAPRVNSRFVIIEGFSDAEMYGTQQNPELGDWLRMDCNNKTAWTVAGRNPYGFGYSGTGTFALHLVTRPVTDPEGRKVGYENYMAGGCLEYWKKAPSIREGQVVNVNYKGNVGGWSSLSTAQRRQIISYMLYGVRYLSDGSFNNRLGRPTTASTNPVVNQAYAQQILVWSAVRGIDPNSALRYYGQNVPYYGRRIMALARENPEHYNYDKTLMLVGEGGSKQDMIVVLKPEKDDPLSGDILVDKAVTGAEQRSGWCMELYDSHEAAVKAEKPLRSGITDSAGRTVFKAVPNGTYYLREAPASRQSLDTENWLLSEDILRVVVNGEETHAGTITNTYNPNYSFTLHKASRCSDAVKQQLKDNQMYSLAGARYKVSLNGQQQEILTTDAGGNAKSSRTYPAGTILHIQEIEAPPGYRLSQDVTIIKIIPGTNKIEVWDEPVFDPPFAVTKVDQITGTPQGDGSFAGAVFKWEYFDNTTWSGTPERTWYFKTGENGRSYFDSGYLAPGYSSDPLYVDNNGNPDLPLGTVTMTEIRNSLGYTVLPQPLRCSIAADADIPTGAKRIFTPESQQFIRELSAGEIEIHEPIDTDLFGSIQVDKIDAVTGGVPQGDTDLSAEFQVVNNSVHSVKIDDFSTAAPGEVCYTFRTDALGHFTSGKIFPLGRYTITEVKPPVGYTLNTGWSQSFTVSADVSAFDFTAASGNACPDTLDLPGSFSMAKLDLDTGSVPQGDATLGGAEFELINNSRNPIRWKDTTVAPSEVLFRFSTDAAGQYSCQGLPLGTYCIQEVTPPEGYVLDSVWQYDFSITPDRLSVTVEPELTCRDQPIKGGLRIIKQDAVSGAGTGADAPLDGISFSVVNESIRPIVISGTTYHPGDVVTHLTIAWDGSQWSAETDMNLPYGMYSITEDEMHPGMANDYYRLNPEKHMVEVHQGDTITVITHVNEMVPGKIVIHKVDPLGTPLAGAKFGLQWSDDNGLTWQSVVRTDVLTKGGCTAPDLADGSLTTGADGMISFSGLWPTLRYRVTELEAPDGYVLLRDTAYEGMLPEFERVYTMTVHNSPGFTFPTTGGSGMLLSAVTGAMMISMSLLCLTFLIYNRKKQKQVSLSRHTAERKKF